MLKNIFNNKKGGLGDFLESYYAYLLIILIIVIFYFVFALSSKAAVITITDSYTENMNLQTSLMGILNAPVMIEGKEWTVADLVMLTTKEECNSESDALSNKDSYCYAMYQNVSALMAGYGKSPDEWNFEINYPSGFSFNNVRSPCATVTLPYDKLINVKFCAK